MEKKELTKILADHKLWTFCEGGKRANLSDANLSYANLSDAKLSGADLCRANLCRANLSYAKLSGADLCRANLYRATIKFSKLPSLSFLSSLILGKLNDVLTLELMRRDAWAHPHPERFDLWANDGQCPYENEDRFWKFELRKDLWKPGKPEIRDSDLIIEICKEKGWKIDGYIE